MYRIIYKADGVIVGVKESANDEESAKIEFDVNRKIFMQITAIPEEDVVHVHVYRPNDAVTAQIMLVDENNNPVTWCEPFEAYKDNLKYYIIPYAKMLNDAQPKKAIKSYFTGLLDFSGIDWGEVLIKFVGGSVIVVLMSWLLISLRSCQDEFKEKEHATWVQSYNNYNPVTIPEEVSVSKTGDYQTAREDFMEEIKNKYSRECYEHSPAKITARIDGDTLWLFASHYKEYANRYAVQSEGTMVTAFKTCKFAKVNISTCDAGGNPVWTIYQDTSVKHATAKNNEQKSNIKPRRTSGGSYTIEDAIDDRVDDYLQEHGIEEADLDQY